MRRRSKEINIFSMSALDLFASALGAFILITIALFPFFPNTGDSPERVAEVRGEMREAIESAEARASQAEAEAAAARGQIESLQQALAQCESSASSVSDRIGGLETQLESCRAALESTFAVVVISWDSEFDVDLHVVDPNGNEYYYAARDFAGSGAAFEEDSVVGPGNEIWQSLAATPGEYEVYVNMFSSDVSGATNVRGFVLHQNGRNELPGTILTTQGQKPLVATFTVDDEGNVSVR